MRTRAAACDRSVVLGSLFLLGIIPRIVLLIAGHASLQSWEYETLAQNIISGHGYTIMHFGRLSFAFGDGNLYSFFAGTVYMALGHKLLVLAFVQALVASVLGPLLFVIAERPLGARVAALGAALGALHPGLLAYTLKLHPLGIDALLLTALVLWLRHNDAAKTRGVMTGLTLGLNLMTRPTFFVAGLMAMALRWLRHESPARRVLLAVAIAGLVALPWVARNWAVLGQPVFMTTSLEDVWKGTNPRASGSGLLPGGRDVLSALPPAFAQRLEAVSELELNNLFGAEVVEFATHDPGALASLTVRKFFYFWWASPQQGLLYPAQWLHAYQLYAAVILGFGLIGAVSILRGASTDARSLLATIAAVSLSLAVVHALAYVDGRHRWGVEPLLLLLTAQGVFVAATWLARNRARLVT